VKVLVTIVTQPDAEFYRDALFLCISLAILFRTLNKSNGKYNPVFTHHLVLSDPTDISFFSPFLYVGRRPNPHYVLTPSLFRASKFHTYRLFSHFSVR